MRVLMFSTDKSAFDEMSETRRRFVAYGGLVEALHVLVIGNEAKASQQISDNVTLEAVGASNKSSAAWSAYWRAGDFIKKEKIDLIVTQSPIQDGFLGCLLARRFGIKLLVSVYGMDIFDPHWIEESWIRYFTQLVARRVLARADAIQTDGFETVESLKKRYGAKVFWKPVVPSDIETFTLTAARPQGDVLRLFFVGRLVKQKNLSMLLDVLTALKEQRPEGWRATIVGDGPLRVWLEAEFAQRQLASCVTYRPKLDRAAMAQAFQGHDVLICTSAYEGFARVFLEAAASGLPIVTTRVSGVSNLVADGERGFVVGQGQTTDFVERIERLMDDRGLWERQSDNIRDFFRQNYTFALTLERQKDIFEYLSKPRLLVYTPTLKPDDPLLGFASVWFKDLAKRCSSMVIVSRFVEQAGAPPDVPVVELGKPLLARWWKLCVASWRYRKSYDVVFVHMTERMVPMGWPLWSLLGKPIYLWYAHGSVTWWLKLALMLSRKVFTSSPAGFRVESPKRLIVGQGIDTDLFRPMTEVRKPEILCISRIHRSKDFEATLDFLADYHRVYPDDAWTFRLIGSSQGHEDYVLQLAEKAKELGLSERVSIEGPQPFVVLPSIYSSAAVFVSTSRTGSIDKVVLEALACGTPVIAAGSGYHDLAGVVKMQDKDGAFAFLHQRLTNPTTDEAARQEVIQHHSLSRLMDVLAKEMNLR